MSRTSAQAQAYCTARPEHDIPACILVEETLKKHHYDPRRISWRSAMLVVVLCPRCKKQRSICKKSLTDAKHPTDGTCKRCQPLTWTTGPKKPRIAARPRYGLYMFEMANEGQWQPVSFHVKLGAAKTRLDNLKSGRVVKLKRQRILYSA